MLWHGLECTAQPSLLGKRVLEGYSRRVSGLGFKAFEG